MHSEMSLQLAAVFADNMVLQQNIILPVWGTAAPGQKVTVIFAGQNVAAQADANGNWCVKLEPMAANSSPQEMTITLDDADRTAITLHNILIGEVWICSGQSNMEWSVGLSKDADAEVANANYPSIRLLTIPQRPSGVPLKQIPAVKWLQCSSDSIAAFSAVGYFFGRELHRRLGVPVGLINSRWGGTVAEAWTSRETLLEHSETAALINDYDEFMSDPQEQLSKYEELIRPIVERTTDSRNAGYPRGWADTAMPDGEWNDMDLPRLWQTHGLNFSGILWFRKEIELPETWTGRELTLAIGATDKSDVTYFNNVKVGSITMAERADAWNVLRTYTIPANLVKPGKNVIAVRVHSDKYGGGMNGPAAVMKLCCPSLPDRPIPLAGIWRYAVEANYGSINFPPLPTGPDNQNSPCTLFNGMISPLIPFAIRGAIWYQGESNIGRAVQYQTLFPALIQDWRKHWAQGEFPFIFVQLANYLGKQSTPSESGWAELREAQTLTLRTPNTGMAVAIDIGETNDIHPKNKQDVGLRLALNALAKTYQLPLAYSGPMFKKLTKQGNTLRIYFDHIEGKLECRGEKLLGFAVAGTNRKFFWADAVIEDDCVVVTAPEVSAPEFVRYAWADNPDCNLYNAAGLPACPFRSDKP